MQQLFENGSSEEILAALEAALGRSDESPFWAEKVPPLTRAALSALLPLREQQLLFTPEGEPAAGLTPELFLRWCDLVCLKHLAFTLQSSNDSGRLERTRHSADRAAAYRPVDLEQLGGYLSGYSVDLQNEFADFPITHYNLHLGIAGVLNKLL
jgi:hypothetical protein